MEGKFGVFVIVVLSVAWQAHAQVTCTTAGRFADTTDPTCQNYTNCVLDPATGTFISSNYICPSTSVFNPNTAQCTAAENYVCPNVTDIATPTSICTADGFIADPNSTDCSSYIQCVNISDTFIETTLTCPADTFYNPDTTLCEFTYICTNTFTCTVAGRFANAADTTCQTYYYCVLSTNGTYVQNEYTCPSTSVFSPTANLCTTNYVCPA